MKSLGTIGYTLETGKPGRDKGDFAGLHANSFNSLAFNHTMAEQSRPVAKVLARAHDFPPMISSWMSEAVRRL